MNVWAPERATSQGRERGRAPHPRVGAWIRRKIRERRRDYAAAQARSRRRKFLRKTRLPLALLSLSWLLGAALIALQPRWFAPYLSGALVVGLGWLIHWFMWTGDGAFWQRMGSEAQACTRKEFEKVRRQGWSAVGPIVFERDGERFDVDLVAVGPRGVLAVETKYTTDVKLSEQNARDRLSRALWQAKQGASDMAALLAQHGIATAVKPVLVLWGPEAPNFSDGWERLKGVTVVAGRQADTWRPLLDGDCMSERDREPIATKLVEIDLLDGPFPA